MVIPQVLVVVGSLLPLNVYLGEGKMSSFEEESPRILAGFSVASSSASSMPSSTARAGSEPTCPQEDVRDPQKPACPSWA